MTTSPSFAIERVDVTGNQQLTAAQAQVQQAHEVLGVGHRVLVDSGEAREAFGVQPVGAIGVTEVHLIARG